MRLLQSILACKMFTKRNFKEKLFLSAFILTVLLNFAAAESRAHVPARILARQTGATQFEEEKYEAHADCRDHKHQLKKRASDEDVDYEVYQGVVGRPGIDFPIYPRIPRTSFSCKSYGNGYFADMETDCQVFHICEEGRKISFLCPNGTIFQQSELTCDWWFKVNCLGSAGLYADSSEILNKQKIQRLKPSVPVQGFNIIGGGLNIKQRTSGKDSQRSRIDSKVNSKSSKRTNSEEASALESIDFDDLSAEKQRGVLAGTEISNIDTNDNDNESQITAESASFVSDHNRNNYNYDKIKTGYTDKASTVSNESSRRGASDRGSQRHGYTYQNNATTERPRSGHRGHQRYREEKRPDPNERTGKVKPSKKEKVTFDNNERLNNPASFYNAGTFTTVRRFESTRTTPFYTPTVPSISKTKTSAIKTSNVKGVTDSISTSHAFDVNDNVGGTFYEPTGFTKAIGHPRKFEDIAPTTIKPFVIGMRHYLDEDFLAGISQDKPKSNYTEEVPSNESINIYESDDYLTTTPAPTGPTYLPKSASAPKALKDAAGDSLLFAPISVSQDDVYRNVNDMLKTMNILKHNLDDVELISDNAKSRIGLDIPPSSGPDALVSLAQYFATEQYDNNASKNLNSVENKSNKKPANKNNKESGQLTKSLAPKEKLSDTTATLTTVPTPGLVKKSDINTSLLSNNTVKKYNSLFGLNGSSDSNTDTLQSVADTNVHKPHNILTPFPQIGATDVTIKSLARKPESRKIARVFSNALTDYLNDPTKFRESLAAMRPIDPTSDKSSKDVTATTFSNQKTGATHLSTSLTSNSDVTDITTEFNIASIINTNLVTSTISPDLESTTDDFDFTTFKSTSEQKSSLELSAELDPPTPDSGEGEEFLQREQTHSFAKPRNKVLESQEKSAKLTTAKPPSSSWSFSEYDEFLDPLKINDGLMKSKTTTKYPVEHLPKDDSSTRSRHSNNLHNVKSVQPKRNSQLRSQTTEDPWQEIFDSYNLPRESLPSNTGLQRIANKLFGGLNESEAYHLKNVMAEAEHDRQILRLLLLLIQTCDDQNGKALERSRKQLINALINMDGKLKNRRDNGRNFHRKEKSLTTTENLPVTTYRRTGSGEEFTTTTLNYSPSTTNSPTSTAIDSTTTTTYDGSTNNGELTTTPKFVIKVEDNERQTSASTATEVPANHDESSDKRALELLKSLYSLASKFTSRR